jgi:tryptophan 2,3-dioxygenase
MYSFNNPWNFLQNRSYLGAQSKFQNYKKIEITPCLLSDHNAIKLELNNKSRAENTQTIELLNSTLLNDQMVLEEIREEVKKFLEFNENVNTTYQNLWEPAKAVQGGKFVVISAYIKNTESYQINNLMLHVKL